MVRVVAAILLFVLPWICFAQNGEIRILHMNDFHGFALPHRPLGEQRELGGIAWLAARAQELRREKPSIFLAAGDMIQGDNFANLFKGESVVRILNAMGLDAMVLGNHEFDFGQKTLVHRIKEARFPVLGANLVGLEGVQPYTLKDVGGLRVAVVGILGADTPVTTHPRNLVGLRFLDPATTLRERLQELSSRAHLIIALTHCGFSVDRELASAVNGVQLIVGGHSHTKLEKPVVVGNTILVQAWEHGKALGVLDLWVEEGRVVRYQGRLEEIGPSMGEPDPKVQAMVQHYTSRVQGLMDEIIGETVVDLDGEGIRHRETNFGNLVSDLLRDVSGAQAAIINGGAIRRSIPTGPVRIGDIYSSLPFDNYVVALSLTGKQLWAALEHGLGGKGSGRFPQISGLELLYDPRAPEGSRLQEVRVNGEPLDPDANYTVATNDFLAAGGDGYDSFPEAIRNLGSQDWVGGTLVSEALVFSEPGRWIRDLLVEHIRSKGRIKPEVEGRIREVEGP